MPFRTALAACHRFRRDERGAVALIFGLAAISLFALGGSALDYGRAARARVKLQHALDEAVIAGLKAGPGQMTATAEGVFDSSYRGEGAAAAQRSFSIMDDGALRGQATAAIGMSYLSLLRTQAITVGVSTEGARISRGYACLMLMDPAAPQTLLVNGGAKVKAPNCEVHVHTTANPAAVFNGNSTFNVRKVCLKGPGYIANGQPQLGPVKTSCEPAPDPFANKIPAPGSLACTSRDLTLSPPNGRQPTILWPGVYCGATNFNGNQDIVLQPGLYVILDGTMTINGGSSLTGAGVTFYFANANSSLQLNGNLTVQLSAPLIGLHAGILMAEPNGLSRSGISLNGASQENYVGLMYLPSRDVTFNGATSVASDNVTMVFNSLTINGGSDWTFDTATKIIPATTSGASGDIVLRR